MRVIARAILAILFIVAGALHFLYTARYMAIVPPILPGPRALVLISGACEILGGIGLLPPGTRRASGLGLILLLIAVFPANIYMAVAHVPSSGVLGNGVAQWIRLPFQFLLIWWAWWCSR